MRILGRQTLELNGGGFGIGSILALAHFSNVFVYIMCFFLGGGAWQAV